jgi:hypothetical protein
VASPDGLVITAGDEGTATITVASTENSAINDTAVITVTIPESTNFDDFNLGSPNGQNGWTFVQTAPPPPYDLEIAEVEREESAFAIFGNQALRISNAVTSNGFDWVYGRPLDVPVGETRAFPTGSQRNNHFELSFDIGTVVDFQQPGLQVSVAPDDGTGNGVRMSYLRFEDRTNGIAVVFSDFDSSLAEPDFRYTDVATNLSRNTPHNIRLSLTTVEGPSNDVVRVYVDGALVHTGTSWEDFYANDVVSTLPNFPNPALINTILIQARTSSGISPNTEDWGYYFDNFNYSSSNES